MLDSTLNFAKRSFCSVTFCSTVVLGVEEIALLSFALKNCSREFTAGREAAAFLPPSPLVVEVAVVVVVVPVPVVVVVVAAFVVVVAVLLFSLPHSFVEYSRSSIQRNRGKGGRRVQHAAVAGRFGAEHGWIIQSGCS